jgi:hypothetical protein
LWDKFNAIKQQTFIAKLPQLVKYLSAKRAALREEPEIKKEPSPYKWAEISLDEERLVEPALV